MGYLTSVLKNPYMSIDEFLIDINANGLDIRRQCLSNEEIQKEQLKQYHKYLISDELEILNKRVHNSIIDSIKNDAKTFGNNSTKVANFFDIFGEFMLYAGCDSLFGQSFTNEQRIRTPNFYKLFQDFDQSFKYGIFRIPFWKIFYRSVYENRRQFVDRFSSLKLNNDESKLIHAREELFRSDAYEHLFTEYDIAAL